MSDNPYKILGLDEDATPDQINAAYKAAAKKAHPDSGGSSEDFTRVKQASMVLLDPSRRKKFDNTGTFEDEADNSDSKIIEAIAAFFISTINSLEEGLMPNVEQSDLIGAARHHFNERITVSRNNIANLTKQTKKFERALKRLKSKRPNDIIRTMLTRHAQLIVMAIDNNSRDVVLNQRALEILKDYEYDFAPLNQSTAQSHSRFPFTRFTGFGQ